MVEDSVAIDRARATLERARDHLLGLQHADGWWQGELETNVTMDAEDLLLREFLGLHDDAVVAAAGRWIRSQQRDDGTWANFYGGPADLSTTVEAYLALRLAGDEPDAPHMKLARDWIVEQGGVEATRVFTRIWLALSGLWSWDDLPVIPPELIYLPSWFPLNIYDWGCWARQTIVALAVVQSFRPSRPIGLSIDELKTGGPHGRAPRPPRTPDARPDRGDDPPQTPPAPGTVPPRPGPRPPRPPRPLATPGPPSSPPGQGPSSLPTGKVGKAGRAAPLRRVDHRQAGEGRLLGRHPAALGVLADGAEPARIRTSHPIVSAGISGLTASPSPRTLPTAGAPAGGVPVPVWDTVLTMTALADAGLVPDDPSLTRAAQWVLGEEIRGPGDWQVRRPKTAVGGWAFEFDNDNYPDTDDTAEVVLALRRVAVPSQGAIDRGLDWLTGCSPRTAAGARSTRTTPAISSTSCRSATSARSSTRPRPT